MSSDRFDLEKALAAWRRPYEHQRAFSREDLDELEVHLRAHLAELQRAGRPAQAAFGEAVRALGDPGEAEAAYGKVYWGKRRRRGELLHELHWRTAMLKNYLTVTFRNLRRHPGYTSINVLGLAVGIAACLVIAAFVQHEFSFDRFHEHGDRIYRVAVDRSVRGRAFQSAMTPFPLARTLEEEFPEVEAATRLFRDRSGNTAIRRGDRGFVEAGVVYADSNVLDVFSFNLLEGDPRTALADPFALVITQSAAGKYFGEEDPLGQTLIFRVMPDRDEFTYTVTGILEDVPAHSHIAFDFLASVATIREYPDLSLDTYSYLRLGPEARPGALEAKFPALFAKYAGPQMQDALGISQDAFQADGNRYRYFLQPLTSIHLHSHLEDELRPNQSALVVYLFAVIAGFILVVAGINFVNLATARAARRAKEVGVRKALGSQQGQIVRQFLTESLIMSGIAVLLAFAVVGLTAPVLASMTGRTDGIPDVSPWILVALVSGLVILVGLGAGAYPAFYMASLRTAAVLKGGVRGRRRSQLRDTLVVVQFTVSIALIAGALVVSGQMRFLLGKDLGYDPEQVIVLEGGEVMIPRAEAFREALRALPQVLSVTNSEKVPGRDFFRAAFRMEDDPADETRRLTFTYASFDFVETLGLHLIEGRSLSRERPGDSLSVLLNEAAVAYLGIDDPIGKHLVSSGGATYEIIGIVEDFHIASLREPVQPIALLGPDPEYTNRPNMLVSARIRADDMAGTVASIEGVWRHFAPQKPFVYSFLDQDVAAIYDAEQRMRRMISVFTGIALVLACCGLFGLSAHAAEQRTKEIGVRKALGASVSSLVALLSADFLKLVGLAFLVAAPLAYFVMQRWLEDFAYRIEIGPGVFLLTGGLVLLIAVLTVSYQAIKAALADPIKSLRYE